MSQPGGLNQFIALPVPAQNGDGSVVDVSLLKAAKAIYFASDFVGLYAILGSHDDAHFVSIAWFTGGEGPKTIKRNVIATLKSIKVHRNADRPVAINIAAQRTCSC